MKKNVLIAFVAICATNLCHASLTDSVEVWKNKVEQIVSTQESVLNEMKRLKDENKALEARVDKLDADLAIANNRADSQETKIQGLGADQKTDREKFTTSIQQSQNNLSKMTSRTILGGGVFSLLLIGVVVYLFVRRRKDSSTMDDVKNAQSKVQDALKKMQEEYIQLDNKMLELIEKQMATTPVPTSDAEMDHSLALKVADEIVRIELNLSRMDATVKGHKQLSKAVSRIKYNFAANGYEIVDMLGMPYNEGMKVVADFVYDDTLAVGEQKITGITKPQINYNGKMIQAAQITVSQNI